MMALIAYCKLRCDDCRVVFEPDAPAMDDPRRQRARAKRAGWQRIDIIVGEHNVPITADNPPYNFTGEYRVVADMERRDLCPQCLDIHAEGTIEQ